MTRDATVPSMSDYPSEIGNTGLSVPHEPAGISKDLISWKQVQFKSRHAKQQEVETTAVDGPGSDLCLLT